jgi:hypothetical protein
VACIRKSLKRMLGLDVETLELIFSNINEQKRGLTITWINTL